MKIGTYGFPDDQLRKLEKILGLSKEKQFSLSPFDGQALPDVLMLFGAEQLEQPLLKQLPGDYRSRCVVVSRTPPEQQELHHIKFPLISSRVIRTLDRFEPYANEAIDDSPAVNEQPENRFSKYDEQIAALKRREAESAPQAAITYSALVVDDSVPMQQMLARELAQVDLPLEVEFADDGETALAKVAQHHYDFIFLDIMMPGIDGFETCTRMRAIPALKKTPIIMLSSKSSPLDEVKGIMAGSSTYLTKPIDHGEFQKVIKRVSRWVSEFKK